MTFDLLWDQFPIKADLLKFCKKEKYYTYILKYISNLASNLL